jgi:hypothetical protein
VQALRDYLVTQFFDEFFAWISEMSQGPQAQLAVTLVDRIHCGDHRIDAVAESLLNSPRSR